MTIASNDVGGDALLELTQRQAGALGFVVHQRTGPTGNAVVEKPPGVARETGDEINRFLLCVLVSKSAKQIKQTAQNSGEYLQTTAIVRGVLQSYRLAAKEDPSLLSGSGNLGHLGRLNGKILKEQINSSVRERVKDSQRRLSRANRAGDETGIKAAKEELARDIADQDRLAGQSV
jgi:hypothetical protein